MKADYTPSPFPDLSLSKAASATVVDEYAWMNYENVCFEGEKGRATFLAFFFILLLLGSLFLVSLWKKSRQLMNSRTFFYGISPRVRRSDDFLQLLQEIL